MKRFVGAVLASSAFAAFVGLLASPALGAPFIVGDTVCGDLKKVGPDATRARPAWVLSGCPQIENLLKPVQTPSCGNGIIETGELCDTGDPDNCGGKGTCVRCLSCGGTTPTPTPTPPVVGPANCPEGQLPHLNRQGFEDWWGIDNVQIEDGDTDTYCFNVNVDTKRLAFAVGDRTGGAQCFQQITSYIPPAGSGWDTQQTHGRDTSYTFFDSRGFLPKGVWRISITANSTPECPDKYQVVAHY